MFNYSKTMHKYNINFQVLGHSIGHSILINKIKKMKNNICKKTINKTKLLKEIILYIFIK